MEENSSEQLSDLNLIDGLLWLLKIEGGYHTYAEVESSSQITKQAMARLRQAYEDGEVDHVSAGLGLHFREQLTGAS